MIRDINEKELARMLFVHERKKIPEIHKITATPLATLYKWKGDEDWETQLINHNLNPRTLAAAIERSILNLYDERAKENKGKVILKGGDGDNIYKLVKARNDILKESNYMGIAFDVMDRFQKLLTREHPKLMDAKFQALIGDFLKTLMEEL